MPRDVDDLVTALGLGKVIIGGWSLGGFAAQVFAATHPAKVSHVLVIATMPPGLMVKPSEPLFFEVATMISCSRSKTGMPSMIVGRPCLSQPTRSAATARNTNIPKWRPI